MRQRLMSDNLRSADFSIRALEFDPQTRVVQVAGRKTVLDARSSRVLQALSEGFGDCVSKDALMRVGWPTQLIHENSLAKAISKLRRTIDGSGLEIAAVYGVGYMLRDSDQTAATAETSPEPQPAMRKSRSGWRTVLMFSIGAVLLTAAVATLAVHWIGQAVPIRRSPPITNAYFDSDSFLPTAASSRDRQRKLG